MSAEPFYGMRRCSGQSPDTGLSDQELECADIEEIKKAEIVKTNMQEKWEDSDKWRVVEYILDAKRFPTFKANKGQVFIEISKTMFSGKKSAQQIQNLWNRGGDGDATDEGDDAGGGDGDGDGEGNEAPAKSEANKSPKKCLTSNTKKSKYSTAQLNEFEAPEISRMIDLVVHDDPDVVQSTVYNGEQSVSDDDSPKKENQVAAQKACEEEIAIAKQWEEREQAKEEREQVHACRLAEEMVKSQNEQWEIHSECIHSDDPLLHACAQKIGQQLAKEEGLAL
ncbi:hypothetical protein BOTBODRAFT_176719 [Botryobasidium botryosum FD-172 SS1]|uniref:No apical meristem-associated C-terminal domain-containing protein n=1 Tax=Botryobasidium botryosum (strain FD-172 SS1) TaxID=930990 RepID=A0A067MKT9_BOTB1|nr:hypothetical protein BOTBODRAFT_176719 [Botryobasidium botryosum FD-172 SS1]